MYSMTITAGTASQGLPDDKTTEIRGLLFNHRLFAEAMEEMFVDIEEVYDVAVSYTNLYRGYYDRFSVSFSIRTGEGEAIEDFSCVGELYLDSYIVPPFRVGLDPCENPEGVIIGSDILIFEFDALGMEEKRIFISPFEEEEIPALPSSTIPIAEGMPKKNPGARVTTMPVIKTRTHNSPAYNTKVNWISFFNIREERSTEGDREVKKYAR